MFLVGRVFQLRGNGYIVDLAIKTHLLLKTYTFVPGLFLAHRLAQFAAISAVMSAGAEKKLMVDLVLPVNSSERVAPTIAHRHL